MVSKPRGPNARTLAPIRRPVHGDPVDQDGDGDFALLMAFGSTRRRRTSHPTKLAWCENRDQPFLRHSIRPLINAAERMAADLDEDGDMDVIGCAWSAETLQLIWGENGATPTPKWVPPTLKSPCLKASGILTGGLNQEGIPDIAGSAERGSNEPRCWLQKKRRR